LREIRAVDGDPGGAAAAAPPLVRARSRPIALHLFILALVALVPAFLFSAILLARNNESQSALVESLITGTSRSIVEAVEREIVGNITTLRVLSTAPALLAGDHRSFHTRTRIALAGTNTNLFLLDPDLNVLMNTRIEYTGETRPSADPASGRRAFDTGAVVVSNALFNPNVDAWVFNVLYPSFPNGQPPMILGLSRRANDLAGALSSARLPEGWNVALVDASGAVIASSPGAAVQGERFALADPGTLGTSAGWVEIRNEDQHNLAVVQYSPLTGWTLYAWAPYELIARPLATAVWSLIVGGILLAAVVVLVIYWVSLQIGRSVHGLEDDARRMGAGETVTAKDYPISELATVSESLADASARRKAAETEVRLLMRELAHRSKNQMTVIAAMAKQSAKGADSVPEFVSSFERRIYGLARSTDLLLAHGIAGVDFRDVIARQVDPLCPLDSGRVRMGGPSFKINVPSAQILGMAAHELATNAVKYGAFASSTGRIEISWTIAVDRLNFTWRERDAPPAGEPLRRGFGTVVLETMVGRSLGAEVDHVRHEDGIEWRFSVPLESLDVHKPGTAEGVAAGDAPAAADARGTEK
jgi:two-component sensor histidine kinase